MEKIAYISHLSKRVIRVLGLNPGPFSLQGTNTYIVGTGKARVLVDAGEGREGYVPLLQRAIEESGAQRISDVVITHYHRDHSEGLKDLRQHFGSDMRAWKLRPEYSGDHGPSFNLQEAGVRPLVDGQIVKTEDGETRLRVLATPGHTPDHCCLVLEQEGAVFSGDWCVRDPVRTLPIVPGSTVLVIALPLTPLHPHAPLALPPSVLGGSSAVFDDLHAYMKSLQRLLSVMDPHGGEHCIYPGHGVVLPDGAKAVREYIAHRTQREEQVVEALRARPRLGLTPLGIVSAGIRCPPTSLHASFRSRVLGIRPAHLPSFSPFTT
jgi:ribonuclease/clavin/mitogillin